MDKEILILNHCMLLQTINATILYTRTYLSPIYSETKMSKMYRIAPLMYYNTQFTFDKNATCLMFYQSCQLLNTSFFSQ